MQSLWLCKTYMKEGREREEGEREACQWWAKIPPPKITQKII